MQSIESLLARPEAEIADFLTRQIVGHMLMNPQLGMGEASRDVVAWLAITYQVEKTRIFAVMAFFMARHAKDLVAAIMNAGITDEERFTS